METDAGNYSLVASEYYNSTLHPTSANLNAATLHGLLQLEDVFLYGNTYCEIGAGKSILAEVYCKDEWQLILVDRSIEMLKYSLLSNGISNTNKIVSFVQGDASSLAFKAESFDGVFGSLADPYNTTAFYSEAVRIIRPGGKLLFSVPDFQWSQRYRTFKGGSHETIAYPISTGEIIRLSSHVYDYDEQVELLKSSGFDTVEILRVASSDCLPLEKVSPNILLNGNEDYHLDIVTLYMANKE